MAESEAIVTPTNKRRLSWKVVVPIAILIPAILCIAAYFWFTRPDYLTIGSPVEESHHEWDYTLQTSIRQERLNGVGWYVWQGIKYADPSSYTELIERSDSWLKDQGWIENPERKRYWEWSRFNPCLTSDSDEEDSQCRYYVPDESNPDIYEDSCSHNLLALYVGHSQVWDRTMVIVRITTIRASIGAMVNCHL